MSESVKFQRLVEVTLLIVTCASVVRAQSLLSELKAEHDPGRRSELALDFADTAFDSAHNFYNKGEIDKGDAQLEDMTNALNECVVSLAVAHKAKFYKKAELKVAYLQRRMQGLLDDIQLQQRGWAEQTQRKLDEIHDKLLDGVMRK
jgi:DNA gyrase/topoisomerase IV subunit B